MKPWKCEEKSVELCEKLNREFLHVISGTFPVYRHSVPIVRFWDFLCDCIGNTTVSGSYRNVRSRNAFLCLTTTPMSNFPCSRRASPASLSTLDDDCLSLIVVALCYTSPKFAKLRLKPFSLTSKRIRAHCLPIMFKYVTWPNIIATKGIQPGDPAPMLPDPVLSFIR